MHLCFETSTPLDIEVYWTTEAWKTLVNHHRNGDWSSRSNYSRPSPGSPSLCAGANPIEHSTASNPSGCICNVCAFSCRVYVGGTH